MLQSFDNPINAAKLTRELIAALPALVTSGGPEALPGGGPSLLAHFTVTQSGGRTFITVPDTTDPAIVSRVVSKHSPIPDPPAATTLEHVIAAIGGAATLDELKAVMQSWLAGTSAPHTP